MAEHIEKPRKQLKASLDELKHVARSTSGNPRLFFSLLTVNFLVCTYAFYPYLGFVKAFLSSVLFTLIWAALFILVPYVLGLLIGLIFLGVIVYAFIAISGTAGSLTALIAIAIGLLVLALVLGLFIWAAFLLPGILLGLGTYGLLGKDTLAAVAGMAVFILATAFFYFLLRYVLPFLTGFFWASITGVLAYRLTGAVFIGDALLGITGNDGSYGGISGKLAFLRDQVFLPLKPPFLLGFWIFIISAVLGIFVARSAGKAQKE